MGMDWQGIHDNTVIVDLHIHPSLKANLFHRDLSRKHKRKLFGRASWPLATRTDFPKMIEGGLDVGVSVVYIPEQGWLDDLPLLNFVVKYLRPKLYRRVFQPDYMTAGMTALDEMEEQVERYNLKGGGRAIRVARSPAELKEGVDGGELCLVHAVEGGHTLQGELAGKRVSDNILSTDQEIADEMLSNLEVLHARGVAYLTLAHFYPNHAVSPCFPYPEFALRWARKDMWAKWDETQGLTPIGEQVVERMFELGMLVDVSHCTPAARARIYELATHHKRRAGVVATHVGVARMNSDPYNLREWEVKWIADNGGVVGSIFMNYWLTGECRKAGVRYIADTMGLLHDMGGEDVVAFGSDFDGFTDPPDDMRDISDLPRLTRQLMTGYSGWSLFWKRRDASNRQWSDEAVRKFMGKNALRVLMEGWRA
jgi:microsomal dipeptidase-like Zn-dependent dipeptidase